MKKKVFDIASREERILKTERKIKIPKTFVFLVLIFLFFLSSILIIQKFEKVKVEIWPKIEEKSFEGKIFADISQKEIDFEKIKFPAKIFEVEKEIEDIFPSTGKILKKAEGKIRLYNQYTTRDERWVARTRFISSEGKIFLAKDSFIVPGAKIKDGKLEPSFVDVEVVAAEGGEEYNIPPSKFSVLAFKGTERFFKYWGESFEPMRGGGEAFIVKKEDLESALNFLKEKIEKEVGKEILKKEIPKDSIFPENLILVQISEKIFSAKEGDEVEKFNLKVKAKIKTALIKKEDLQNFLEKNFYSNIGQKKKILRETEKVEIFCSVSNFEEGKFLILLKSSVKILPEIDPSFVEKQIAGKEIEIAKSRLEAMKGIEKIKLEAFPFWISKIPENLEKIEVSIKLD